MLNRKKMPALLPLGDAILPVADTRTLSNGIPMTVVGNGIQDAVKLEILFRGGRWAELQNGTSPAQKQLVARIAIRLLREATLRRSSREVAETVDFYAGTLRTLDSLDYTGIVLYCLTKHLEPLLALVQEMLLEPAYDLHDLETYTRNAAQSLRIELDKNDVVAYREITAAMFGSTHPYGYNSTEAALLALTPDDLRHFHRTNLVAENAFVVLSGKVTAETAALVDTYLSVIPHGTPLEVAYPVPLPLDTHTIHLPRPDALQSAINLAHRTVTRHNPDYPMLRVLNTVFGGYFGSRLMANIREEKGYTYGIYSEFGYLRYDNYWYISSEVGKPVAAAALAEIRKEISRIQTDLIPARELETVRNYLLGQHLSDLDGAFQIADTQRSMILMQYPEGYYASLIEAIRSATPTRLRDLAQQYFKASELYEVVVG